MRSNLCPPCCTQCAWVAATETTETMANSSTQVLKYTSLCGDVAVGKDYTMRDGVLSVPRGNTASDRIMALIA